MYVQVGNALSETWNSDIGVIQGGKCSGELYNIASITQSLWNIISISTQYADDNIELVIADSVEECQRLAKEAADKMVDWYLNTGFSLNSGKSEIMSFNCSLKPIEVGDQEIQPKSCMKFLGLSIQADLKWQLHIDSISNKIRRAAAKIRNDGKLYSIQDKRVLYFAWIQGTLRSNLLSYMPYISTSQFDTLQTAANAGVRAVVGARRYGHIPMSKIRKDLNIPSVRDLHHRTLYFEAWKNRDGFRNISNTCRSTRATSSGNIVLKNVKGWTRQTTIQKLSEAWNDLPVNMKNSEKENQVKSYLNKRFHNN